MQVLKEKYLFLTNHLEKHKKYNPAIFFVLGFLFDIITLGEAGNIVSIIQQCIYIGAIGWILRSAFMQQEGLWKPSEKIAKYWIYHSEAVHFLLGGLLSVYTLFFFVSSSLSVSLFFLVMMMALLILNEVPSIKKQGLMFKYLLYSVCLLSFFLFLVPLLAGTVSILAFIAALVVSSLLSFLNYRDLLKKGIDKKKLIQQMVTPTAITVFVFVFLYFSRILPPVPLSTKYMGIYHSVTKENGKYRLGYTRGWWRFWQNGDESFFANEGDKIYYFVRVFAPSTISQPLIFHWQSYQSGRWVTMDKVPIKIRGGREHGYRGYVVKANYQPGDWRVSLESEDGREISRINFEIIKDNSSERKESYDYQ